MKRKRPIPPRNRTEAPKERKKRPAVPGGDQPAGDSREIAAKSGSRKIASSDKGSSSRPAGGRRKRTPRKRAFPVVGIGASAGGIYALKQLIEALPRDVNMALIVIQHLDPRHKSMLPEILAKSSALPVTQAEDGMDLEPGKVFVIPPTNLMEVHDGKLNLSARPETGSRMLVDALLESLASAYKHLAIGVVLSGSGSDGAFGVRAIKSEGGITFAQDRESAEYYSMPEHAIASGNVDFVLRPAEIAKKLIEISDHPYLKGESVVPERRDIMVMDSLVPIFEVLKKTKGVDFSLYRRSTVERRVERRMALNRLEDYDKYVALLKRKPEELNALHEDLLIQVTSFFRTPDLYEALEQKIYPKLVENLDETDDLRVWVPGCSTGEEAYSLAISLFRFLESRKLANPLRVFATDLNENLIDRARQGIYPESITEHVPEEILKRFFARANGGYQIHRFIRDLCVFAKHDLTRDPPFSNVDLLSCRNVMIYLQPVLQDRLLPVFHYALKPRGYLVLGDSESIGSATDLFRPADKKHRIYAKRVVSRRPELELDLPFRSSYRGAAAGAGSDTRAEESTDLEREMNELLLSRYVPAAVLVDDHMRIISFRGRTGPFIQPASGRASLDLMTMVQPGLALDLGSALQSARDSNRTAKRQDIQVEFDGHHVAVDLEVTPLGTQGDYKYFLVVFSQAAARTRDEAAGSESVADAETALVAKLRRELSRTKQHLQSIIEQKEATNEELKSANEEIRSSNEELQSLNEEMETSREELQSTNEELTTLNEELQHRNEELSRVNSDLNNILENTRIPIIIVDENLKIPLFTPSADTMLNIRNSDAGRPLTDITLRADIPDLPELIAKSMSEVLPVEREVQDHKGHWYDLRVRPYVGMDKRIEGAVISFIDINEMKRTLQKSNQAELLAKRAMEMAPAPMVVLDRQLKINSINNAFERFFKVSRERAEGQKFFSLNGGMFDIPDIAQSVERTLARKGVIQEVRLSMKIPGAGERRVSLVGQRLDSGPGIEPHFILTFNDSPCEVDEERKPGS